MNPQTPNPLVSAHEKTSSEPTTAPDKTREKPDKRLSDRHSHPPPQDDESPTKRRV
ncbi:hypothetical protein ASPZODRAFT_16472 [Penicilliopsis zonata CBS 506.65]|uniref:Uncharacterized protein n=1 Tax=Penicilliopsis zonata CBS 506.65 TaxID=1073090 RepID=A0A1L9SHM3_9EURO|nr:hypothetical protein ASPZODRAFT_16472 [Penicilliopsis zonata CBS 506.65]OJJ46720.1 hypothetical protein ASPZODRAFT_16472 [Penicilliopsis zonata CBS 506.65]